jgi:hypothetical protein
LSSKEGVAGINTQSTIFEVVVSLVAGDVQRAVRSGGARIDSMGFKKRDNFVDNLVTA